MSNNLNKTDLYIPVFDEEKGVTAFFTTRHGESKEAPFYNREVLEKSGLAGKPLVWPNQVHSQNVTAILKGSGETDSLDNITDTKGEGFLMKIQRDGEEVTGLRIPDTDGVMTNVPGVVLTSLHADCVGLFFYDPINGAIAVTHAGWRGTVAGIGCNTVRMMEETYGSKPEDIMVYISPCISMCCFEVGKEVYNEFADKWDFMADCSRSQGEKYYLDLKKINRMQLKNVGIKDIEVDEHCTYCEPENFASYRREGVIKTRMGAIICLTE